MTLTELSSADSLWYSGSIVAAWTSFGSVRIQNNWAWSVLLTLPSDRSPV